MEQLFASGPNLSLHAYLKRRDSALAHSLVGAPSSRLLDIGSGEGEDLRGLIEMGWQAIGVEPFQKATGVPYVKGAAEKLPFKNGVFGVVTCVLVLPILPHPQAAIEEAYRVLRHGGAAIFTVFSTSPLNLKVAVTKYTHRRAEGPPASQLFPKRRFLRMLNSIGFDAISWVRTDYLPWFAGRLSSASSGRLFAWLDNVDCKLGFTPLSLLARKFAVKAVKG